MRFLFSLLFLCREHRTECKNDNAESTECPSYHLISEKEILPNLETFHKYVSYFYLHSIAEKSKMI